MSPARSQSASSRPCPLRDCRLAPGVVLAWVGWATAGAMAQPTFTPMGALPGASWSIAQGVSDDGQVVVGSSGFPAGSTLGFVWSAQSGMVAIESLPDCPGASFGLAISGDGSVAAGHAICSDEFTPTERGILSNSDLGVRAVSVPNILTLWTRVRGLSNDAAVFGGDYQLAFNLPKAFYNADGVWHLVSPLGGDVEASGSSISGNGEWMVGESRSATRSRAVRWNIAERSLEAQDLGTLPGMELAVANAINYDGSVIVGSCSVLFPSPGEIPFVWTPALGMHTLGALPTTMNRASATCVSNEGTVIGGWGMGGLTQRAMLYRSDLGMVDLQSYLAGLGLDFGDWTLHEVTGIADDGAVLVGIASRLEEDPQAWIITGMPGAPICLDVDVNNDGALFDPTDIDAFFSVFSEGPCVPESAVCDSIDFNQDGAVFDPCDIASFMLMFSEGACTRCGQ